MEFISSISKLLDIMNWFIVLVATFCFYDCCTALTCEYYSSLKNEEEEHPCTEEELREDGSCYTKHSCENVRDLAANCFVSWENNSGIITLQKKGCWNTPCDSRPTCIATSKIQKNIFLCCCSSDLCNTNYSTNFDFETPVTKESSTTKPLEESNATLVVVLCILVPITIICVVLIFLYAQRRTRKRKADFKNIEIDSVETPSSGITAASTPSNSLPPSINLPHLIEMKARGRFGCVWKAQLKDHYVAVKTFCLQDKQSWLNEQEIFHTDFVCSHPNILRFIAAASRGTGVETELWLITEFHELGSLADYLKSRTVPLTDALRIMESMATGLAFLHEDILCSSNGTNTGRCKPAIAHRDFKSKNVLITNNRTAVIADFGLAVKFIPGESPGETHGQVGTRRYMAPEILEGAINFQRDAFLRIDIYAFALVLWEVVTRCADAPEGASPMYMMPYEDEIGQHPTIEEMQDVVVDKKIRPRINHAWTQHPILNVICETIEECWDHDVEARLSAGCVEERLRTLQSRTIITPAEIPLQANSIPLSPASVDIDQQNHINSQKNEMNANEESRLINGDSCDEIFVSTSLITCDTETDV